MAISEMNYTGGGSGQSDYEYIGNPTATKVLLSYKPKKILIQYQFNENQNIFIYDEDVSTTHTKWISNGGTPSMVIMDNSGNNILRSVDNEGGFTLADAYVNNINTKYLVYMAVG